MQVVIIKIERADGLVESDYRFFDGIQWVFGVREDKLKVRLSWKSHDKKSRVQTQVVDLEDHAATIDQRVILERPDDTNELIVDAHREVGGLQDCVRGDPLYGSGSVEINDSSEFVTKTVQLLDSNAHPGRGNITLSFKTELREPMEMFLCTNGVELGLQMAPMCHWALGLKRTEESDGHVYEVQNPYFPLPAPMCILGPRGVLAHSISSDYPEQDATAYWAKLKEERKSHGLIPPEALERLESDEDIPLEELFPMFPGASIKWFQSMAHPVGSTFFTVEELEEFVKAWVPAHPEYHCLNNSCQGFVRDLHSFLSCGNDFSRYTDKEIIRTSFGYSGFTMGFDR